jgi:hypothetical protein
MATLRFASRMSCVENHPTRNRLVPRDGNGSGSGNAGASVALLQRHLEMIESLKKELALREALGMRPSLAIGNGMEPSSGGSSSSGSSSSTSGGNEPWLPALTTQQTLITRSLAASYSLQGTSNSTSTSPGSGPSRSCSSGPSHHFHPTIAPSLHLRSLSQLRVFASTMRRALHVACGHDSARIEEALAGSPQRPIYLSIYPSIYLFIYFIYLFIYLFISLSIYLSIYLSIHPSIYLSIYLSPI